MAASRGSVVLFCLGTVAVLLMFFVLAAEAEASGGSAGEPTSHAVKHKGRCGGVHSGDQCQDEEDNEEDDDINDDVDDTYKIVNKIRVSLSHTSMRAGPAESSDDGEDGETPENVDQFNVLGH